MSQEPGYTLRVIWACMKKDIKSALTERVFTILSIFVPVNILILLSLFVLSGGQAPTAVVMNDTGAYAQKFYDAMSHAHSFRLQVASASDAQNLITTGKIVAVVTIPADFDARIQQNRPVQVDVQINNLNTDFTNDIRRSVPDAITQYYQVQGSASPVKVTVQETDLRHRDVQLFEYSVLPTILLLLSISGLINGGLSTAREWESRTVKELLLSPASRAAIIAGKVLAGFAITMILGTLVLLLGDVLGWTQPQGIYWLNALLTLALVSLFSAGLGVAIGAALQRIQAVIAISINIAIYLFFLAGGIGVLAFEPGWLQNIAAFVPLTYGRHALEQAIFYSSSDQFGLDMAVLAISALVTVGLGILSMRRGIAS